MLNFFQEWKWYDLILISVHWINLDNYAKWIYIYIYRPMRLWTYWNLIYWIIKANSIPTTACDIRCYLCQLLYIADDTSICTIYKENLSWSSGRLMKWQCVVYCIHSNHDICISPVTALGFYVHEYLYLLLQLLELSCAPNNGIVLS